MGFGQKLIPTEIQLNYQESILQPNQARIIKNLVYSLEDTSVADSDNKGQTGVYKPLQSTVDYLPNLTLPAGYNQSIGTFSFKDGKEVFVLVYNENSVHTIYRINGSDGTYNIVYQKSTLNFQLKPEYFVHIGGIILEVIYVTDPATGEQRRRSFLMFTDGYNYQRHICVEDAIATNGFDPASFNYFAGNYDPMILINMGVPTPEDCIQVNEVAPTEADASLNNKILFNTWQFRLRYLDVWGRPSEYGNISDLYIPANDCISSSSLLSRCVDLVFNAPPPHINQIEIAYRNCNDQQWSTGDTLDLYNGSNLGDWWLRQRNQKIKYDAVTNKITYQFCADKQCRPIAPTNTNRLENPLPRNSQAVFPLNGFVGLANNKDKFLPFSQDLMDKIKATVIPSTTSNSNFGNATILVEIFNPFSGFNQPIYEQAIAIGDPNKAFGFGSFETDVFRVNVFENYLQYFKNHLQKGFVGYLGASIFTISKQFVLDLRTGVYSEVKVYPLSNDPDSLQYLRYFQQFEFNNIPKGIYPFRIASHRSDPSTDNNWRRTSTYTTGTFGFNFSDLNTPVDHSLQISSAPELIVDICTANYDSRTDNKILTIWDLSFPGVAVNQGYVYNTSDTTNQQYGVELLRVNGGMLPFQPRTTDFNGFYFAASTTNRFTTQIIGYCACQLIELAGTAAGSTRKVWEQDFYLDTTDGACPNPADRVCNIIQVKGKVLLCGTQIGVPNVTVVLSRGKSALTDANGEFTIIAYDDTINPTRVDSLYFISNTCNFTDCNDACIQPIQVVINKCTGCAEREQSVANTFVKFISLRGLLSGATYPIGVTGEDWLGRFQFVQPLGNITMPSVNETHSFVPAQIRIDIDPNAVFPAEFTNLKFWIGDPIDISKYETWIVDSVDFIDNTGKVNEIAPTQIKIGYASLIEYNKQNNYNTTVNWDFLAPLVDTETTQRPFITDKVQFLLNGDGTFFSKSITQLIKYDQDGQFFLINYTDDLKDLKKDAIIRLVRPKACTDIEPYFGLCTNVPLSGQHTTINSFILPAFDTYYLSRQIPVPVKVGDETVNELRFFGVPFEHNSPSDFWGEGCKNTGRINYANPQETELYSKDQIALSGAISKTGQLNFLNYFDEGRKIEFNNIGLNGIVGVFPEVGIILILGQSDWGMVGYNDDIPKINASGQLTVPSLANEFGNPQTKVGNNFGCVLVDKNSIAKYEGIVQFVDSFRGDLVKFNYQKCESLSEKYCDGYFRHKCKSIQEYNETHELTRYFHGIINTVNNEYILSDYIIKSNIFYNDLRYFDATVPETIAFNMFSGSFKVTYEFVPELYAKLDSEKSDNQLWSLLNGKPQRHYTVLSKATYGTIYGRKVNRILEAVVVMDGMTKKKPLAVGVICKESLYFADRVTTETNQETRMLKSQWMQAEYAWYAPVLCSLNTPTDPNLPMQTGVNVLFDGQTMVGNWIKIRFVGDPDKDDQYSELQGILCSVFPDANNLIPRNG